MSVAVAFQALGMFVLNLVLTTGVVFLLFKYEDKRRRK